MPNLLKLLRAHFQENLPKYYRNSKLRYKINICNKYFPIKVQREEKHPIKKRNKEFMFRWGAQTSKCP